MSAPSTVFVVDDDQAVRDSLTNLLSAADIRVEAYPDAKTFLAAYRPEHPGCLVLDLQLPGMGGLHLQEELVKRGDRRPIIFLTAHGMVSHSVQALKQGAYDFLEKPADGGTLLVLITKAMHRDMEQRRHTAIQEHAQRRCATLTEREHEILQMVITGNSNKEIARLLDISHRTVELHRIRVMQKTGAKNAIELAAIAQAAGYNLEISIVNNTEPETG